MSNPLIHPDSLKKPIKQHKPKWRKAVRKVSKKKAKSDRIYNAMVKEWLSEDYCAVALNVFGKFIPATCCHHVRGRNKTLKFDKRFWCATSFEYNLWPHQNIEKARQLGLIAQKGEWNVAPDDEETARIKAWMQEQKIW